MFGVLLPLCLLLAAAPAPVSNTFVVASYNVENWNSIERRGKPDQPKPETERAAVIEILAQVRPDVLGLIEMGQTNDLADLTTRLHARGLDYPHQEWIQAHDTERHVALLSRFPIVARNPHTTDTHRMGTNNFQVSRGFIDVTIRVHAGYEFRAFVAHLKSKRASEDFDQAVMRLGEARLLRGHIEHALKESPTRKVIALGDFNDTPETEPIRTLVGVPPFQLFDLLPTDSTGRHSTHLWRGKWQYSRIDYLLVSPGLSNDYVAGSARIADFPGWDKASDHRAIFATFRTGDAAPPPVAPIPAAAPAGNSRLLIIVLVAVAVGAFIIIRQRRPAA